jgi:hypothetical protein
LLKTKVPDLKGALEGKHGKLGQQGMLSTVLVKHATESPPQSVDYSAPGATWKHGSAGTGGQGGVLISEGVVPDSEGNSQVQHDPTAVAYLTEHLLSSMPLFEGARCRNQESCMTPAAYSNAGLS